MWIWYSFTRGVREAWPAVGPLIGVLIGAYITNRNQRRHWVLDNKRNEYRELISAITRAITLVANMPPAARPEDQRAAADAEVTAIGMINDRIFIAREIEKLHVLNRWHEVMRGLVNRTQGEHDFNKLREDLIESAVKLYE
jgi:hypothetical protein